MACRASPRQSTRCVETVQRARRSVGVPRATLARAVFLIVLVVEIDEIIVIQLVEEIVVVEVFVILVVEILLVILVVLVFVIVEVLVIIEVLVVIEVEVVVQIFVVGILVEILRLVSSGSASSAPPRFAPR